MQEIKVDHIVVGDIAANCWIYPLAGTHIPLDIQIPSGFQGCALIDPGDEAPRIIAHLRQLRLHPVYILLTHGHFDHIAALPSLVEAYRKQAEGGGKYPLIAIHQNDAEYLGAGAYQAHYRSFAAMGAAAYIDEKWEDMPPPDILLTEGDVVGPFTILSLPGHTPGSVAFWDKKAKILFSGDTLFKGDYGRSDLPGGSEPTLIASLKRLFALDGEIRVYPGHDSVTSIGREAARGKNIVS
jgi:glyoxylase-like metal-dependent hydrolase (beta-lactamase superfamily II)